MSGLESIVQKLVEAGICGDLWIDGSFITEKIDPEDVDLLLHIKPDFLRTITHEQEQMILWFAKTNLKGDYSCDSYVFHEYPPEDARAATNEWRWAYWIKQYGWSRKEDMKGIVRITIPDGATCLH